jgi:hypothetical protein
MRRRVVSASIEDPERRIRKRDEQQELNACIPKMRHPQVPRPISTP